MLLPFQENKLFFPLNQDSLFGLVVRDPGYRSRGLVSIPGVPDILRSSRSETSPLSLVSTIEELLERKSSGSGLERRDAVVGIRHAYYATTLYPQKLELISPTRGCRSVGIVCSRTQTTEFVLFCFSPLDQLHARLMRASALEGEPRASDQTESNATVGICMLYVRTWFKTCYRGYSCFLP
jgi:hypothetical protein